MQITRMKFMEIGKSRTKRGTCPGCGAMAQRSKRFSQTLNPFNTDKDGNVKTKEQISDELDLKILEWRKLPTYHARCED